MANAGRYQRCLDEAPSVQPLPIISLIFHAFDPQEWVTKRPNGVIDLNRSRPRAKQSGGQRAGPPRRRSCASRARCLLLGRRFEQTQGSGHLADGRPGSLDQKMPRSSDSE